MITITMTVTQEPGGRTMQVHRRTTGDVSATSDEIELALNIMAAATEAAKQFSPDGTVQKTQYDSVLKRMADEGKFK